MRKTKTMFSKNDTLQTYLDEIRQIPLLTQEEEQDLFKRIKVKAGDKIAKEKLIRSNLRLVVKIARAYIAVDPSLQNDIVQEGNLGLIHAVEKYDLKRSVRFSTYASIWIRQYISRFLSTKRRDIHIPHRKEECLRHARKIEQDLSQILMRQPTTKEIAAEMRMSVEEISLLLNMTNSHVPLEFERLDEEATILDICEDYTYNPEHAFFKKDFQDITLQMLNELKPREKLVLMHRYELNGCKWYTLRKIGDRMQLSSETIRQIENRALKKVSVYAKSMRESLYAETV